MKFFLLQVEAFLRGFYLEHLFRGEDHIGKRNLHGKHEIWLSKRHTWFTFNPNKSQWASKIGMGETKDAALLDAMPKIQTMMRTAWPPNRAGG